MITAQTSAPASAEAVEADDAGGPAPAHTALAGAIDAQARRMDQLSAAIVRATSQVTWSGRAAERFRARAAERSRECLQLAVALRASAERVHAAETARPATHAGQVHAAPVPQATAGKSGHEEVVKAISGMVGARTSSEPVAAGVVAGAGVAAGVAAAPGPAESGPAR